MLSRVKTNLEGVPEVFIDTVGFEVSAHTNRERSIESIMEAPNPEVGAKERGLFRAGMVNIIVGGSLVDLVLVNPFCTNILLP